MCTFSVSGMCVCRCGGGGGVHVCTGCVSVCVCRVYVCSECIHALRNCCVFLVLVTRVLLHPVVTSWQSREF